MASKKNTAKVPIPSEAKMETVPTKGKELELPQFEVENFDYTHIYFNDKPNANVRTILKDAKFQFNPKVNNPTEEGIGVWHGRTSNLAGTIFEKK